MDKLIKQMIQKGDLKSPGIIRAFEKIKRQDFLPNDQIDNSQVNEPIPIGHGQTNSQPHTVAFMLELLEVQEGQKVLDVGSGSGWTTALLAEIVSPTGHVFAIERIAELKEFGQHNVKKYNFLNTDFFCQDGHDGLSEHAPFDRILVSAAAIDIPFALKEQLAVGGIMVVPTESQDIRVVKKIDNKNFAEEVYPGFIFVPLIKD